MSASPSDRLQAIRTRPQELVIVDYVLPASGNWRIVLTVEERDWLLAHLEAVERERGLSLSLRDDPMAITELLDDGNRERERLHALLLEIMRALPDGAAMPQDVWPQAILDLRAERDRLAAEVTRLKDRIRALPTPVGKFTPEPDMECGVLCFHPDDARDGQ